MERIVHCFPEATKRPYLTPVTKTTGKSLLKLFICQEEEKISNNSELVPKRNNYSTNETQPNTSLNKISPR